MDSKYHRRNDVWISHVISYYFYLENTCYNGNGA